MIFQVGGMFTVKVLNHMKLFGRVSICGSISNYNDTSLPTGTKHLQNKQKGQFISPSCQMHRINIFYFFKQHIEFEHFNSISISISISKLIEHSWSLSLFFFFVGPLPFFNILKSQLKIEGFIVMRWYAIWEEGEKAMLQWIKKV